MKKPRLPAIEYIRGISMLGVIGIHVGSQYLSNTAANIHLIALFEIASRFSVPIFFFISAFGLFYNLDIQEKLDYKSFLVRRCRTVLVPYIAWSLFYMLHYTVLYHDPSPLNLHTLLFNLFFGSANYHIYFLVILLWFYLFMPLWIWMVRRATRTSLCGLLLFQIAFDYYSSFIMNPYDITQPLLKALLVYRLNYWVLHYVFIFILGGYLAVHIDAFKNFMQNHRNALCIFFWGSLAALLAYYYKLLFVDHYTALEGINTAHQLCPAGIFYTIAASLFFFTIFTYNNYPEWLHKLLSLLGKHSYFIYLAHPVTITYLALLLQHTGRVMTAPLAVLFYGSVVILTAIAAIGFRHLGTAIPLLNKLTIGVYPRKK